MNDMKDKQYVVTRTDFCSVTCEVFLTSEPSGYVLPHCNCLSSRGFNCGSRGCGPTDLALSILADFFDEPRDAIEDYWTGLLDGARHRLRSIDLYQGFREFFLVPMKLEVGETDVISSTQIELWLQSVSLEFLSWDGPSQLLSSLHRN